MDRLVAEQKQRVSALWELWKHRLWLTHWTIHNSYRTAKAMTLPTTKEGTEEGEMRWQPGS